MHLSLWYHQVTQVSRYVYHYWLKEEGLTWPVLDLVNPIIRLEPFMSPWVYSCAWIYSRASSWWIKTIFQYGGISFSSPNVELNSKCPNKDILPAFMHKYNTDVGQQSCKRLCQEQTTAEPVLSGTVLSGHPQLSGLFSKSWKSLLLMYCNFDLY